MTALDVWSRARIDAARTDATPAAALGRPTFAVSAVHCDDHEPGDECRYQVAWSINPHMSIGSVDFARAAAEHGHLVAALEAIGAVVQRLPFVHGAYDSVFVKDPALLLANRGRRRALLARFRHRERSAERLARAHAYARHGYEIVSDDHGPLWEGGDIVMLPSGAGMLLGHGFRTEAVATAWLEHHADLPVWPLELRDAHLYHLDMVLAILPDGTAFVCPWALAPASLRLLERVPSIQRLVHVSRESALGFALNLVATTNTVVLGSSDRYIEGAVRALGYRCIVVPLRQFHLAGGSAACLVAAVHHAPLA